CAEVTFVTPGLALEAVDLVSTLLLVLLSTVAPVLLSTLLLVLLSTVAPVVFSTLLLVLLSIVAFDLLSTLPGAFSPFVGLFSDFSSPFSSDEAPVVSCFWTCAALGAFFSPAFIAGATFSAGACCCAAGARSGAGLFSLGRFWADATPARASTAAATVDSNTVFILLSPLDTPRDANCAYSVGKRRAGAQVPITGAIAALAIAFPVPAGHASPIGLIQRVLLACFWRKTPALDAAAG